MLAEVFSNPGFIGLVGGTTAGYIWQRHAAFKRDAQRKAIKKQLKNPIHKLRRAHSGKVITNQCGNTKVNRN